MHRQRTAALVRDDHAASVESISLPPCATPTTVQCCATTAAAAGAPISPVVRLWGDVPSAAELAAQRAQREQRAHSAARDATFRLARLTDGLAAIDARVRRALASRGYDAALMKIVRTN